MSSWNVSKLSGIAVLGALVISCQKPATVTSAPPSAYSTNRQVFQVKGVIKELLPERKKISIAHEKIPNYMDAMTMEFDVKDAAELAGLASNDIVAFRMIVTEKDGWIDQLKKIGTNAITSSESTEIVRRVLEVDPINVGDRMPDYHFTNEFGLPFNLSDLKGQALGITFIFTRCPFPTFCPRLSHNFSEAQNKLKSMTGGPANWRFLSITIDPEFDTPAVLANYARNLRYDTNHWTFATGQLINITAIAEQFGLYFWKEKGTINHNVRTIVVDAKGRVQWITKENEWKPEMLVDEMVKAANAN